MERIISDGKTYTLTRIRWRKEFEQHVIKNANDIFGPHALYIDIKRELGR